MTLDHNKFLVFADIEIYQYEIKDYNKIVYKNKKEWDKPVRDKTEIEKIFGNQNENNPNNTYSFPLIYNNII